MTGRGGWAIRVSSGERDVTRRRGVTMASGAGRAASSGLSISGVRRNPTSSSARSVGARYGLAHRDPRRQLVAGHDRPGRRPHHRAQRVAGAAGVRVRGRGRGRRRRGGGAQGSGLQAGGDRAGSQHARWFQPGRDSADAGGVAGHRGGGPDDGGRAAVCPRGAAGRGVGVRAQGGRRHRTGGGGAGRGEGAAVSQPAARRPDRRRTGDCRRGRRTASASARWRS